jgi:Na+/melibiose symporter-like transporter
MQSQEEKPKITSRTWVVMAALAITGQIAWAVENTWFNSFVYETITPDPRPVSIMVAASAIMATLTTILMGTLSDRARTRWGKRKPFILIGYVFWGLMTAVFPMASFIKTTSIAVIMVVMIDCLMTFFGSTANDAAFNAWTADLAPSHSRGKVEGVLNLSVFIAQLISWSPRAFLSKIWVISPFSICWAALSWWSAFLPAEPSANHRA